MAFKEIKGQTEIIDFFRNCVNRQRLAHAYLFLGPDAPSKALLAKNLAKLLNCEAPERKEGLLFDCCQRCPSCRKIDNLNHPDVHWISFGGQKKISIDQVRLLQKEISLKPYQGRFKIFIIEQAQRMSEQAANSLLKILEEPPEYSLIILSAPDRSGLLETIISRSQIVKFSADVQAPSPHQERIKEKRRGLLNRLMQFKPYQGYAEAFSIKDKKELNAEMEYLLFWFRDLIFYRLGLDRSKLINQDKFAEIKQQASEYKSADLEEIIEQIDYTYKLLEQNVSPKIALETMTRRIAKCRK